MSSLKFPSVLPTLLASTAMLVITQAQVTFALSPVEIEQNAKIQQIAKSVTVRIDSQTPGSGVIIKREGSTYTVLTAAHVVATEDTYQVIAPDNKRYPITYSTIKRLPGADLAILNFTSNQIYSVVKMGDSTKVLAGDPSYSGFMSIRTEEPKVIFIHTKGQITVNANRPLEDGYALVHSTPASPDMSGGPLLNDQGLLIGIHGRTDAMDKPKGQNNLGIPINIFLGLIPKVAPTLGFPAPTAVTIPNQFTADDYFLQAVDKSNKSQFKAAIANYDQVIRLNPNFAEAYLNRGIARASLKDFQGAIADYNQMIRLKPEYAAGYTYRGLARMELGDIQGQRADNQKVCELMRAASQKYGALFIPSCEP